MKEQIVVRRKEYPRWSKDADIALSRYWQRRLKQIVLKYHIVNIGDLEQYLQTHGYLERAPMSSVGPYLQWLVLNDAEVRNELYI
jgi:hypothetical protein